MINLFKKWKTMPLFVSGTIIILVSIVTYIIHPLFLTYLDNKIYDIFLLASPKSPPSNATIIVDLDEESLARIGQWPWPRYVVALMLEKIRQAGALAIGMDILFAEPDRTSPARISQELKKYLGVDVTFQGLPPELLDNDEIFARILDNPAYVLGYFFDFENKALDKGKGNIDLPVRNVAIVKEKGAPEPSECMIKASAPLLPLPIFLKHVKSIGFFNTQPGLDGVLRATPFLIWWNGKVYPSLSLATLLQAMPGVTPVLKISYGGIESIRIGKTIIPLDENGNFWINFPGPGKTLPYISAADVLLDKISPQIFKNKIVFIGTSATGLLDMRTTPLDPVYPGVEAHAAVVENILTNNFIIRPSWIPGLEVLLIAILGIILMLLIVYARPLFVTILVILSTVVLWMSAKYLFAFHHIFLSPSVPLLNLGMLFSFLFLQKFFAAEQEKKFYRSAFSQYVAPQVVEQIIKSPEKLSLEGEEKEVSILFSDVRGFTTISERLTPEQVSKLLHKYFSPMTKIITNHHGTLDKFIGDAIMAFWNAPLDVQNHQKLAVKAALEMLITLYKLNKEFLVEFGVDMKIGVGIHCGIVSVGNMGSSELFDYTIIGDNVNLASRLEGLTKFYGRTLLISETIASYCEDEFYLQEIDKVRVKGKVKPVTIYTPHTKDRAEKLRGEFELYDKALSLYKSQDFQKAAELFRKLREEHCDLKLYALYHERCLTLAQNPPGKEWDGVFTHKTK